MGDNDIDTKLSVSVMDRLVSITVEGPDIQASLYLQPQAAEGFAMDVLEKVEEARANAAFHVSTANH